MGGEGKMTGRLSGGGAHGQVCKVGCRQTAGGCSGGPGRRWEGGLGLGAAVSRESGPWGQLEMIGRGREGARGTTTYPHPPPWVGGTRALGPPGKTKGSQAAES